MKKYLNMTLSSLLVLGALSGCSSKSSEQPTVVLPDVSSNTSTTTVTPAVTVPDTAVEEPEVEVEEEIEEDAMASATLDYSTQSAKVIQIAPYLIVADDETNQAYAVINGFEPEALEPLTIGSICQMAYVHITYDNPDSTGNPDSLLTEVAAFMLIPAVQGQDLVGAYMDVVKSAEGNLSSYANIALDLEDASNLSESEKEALLWYISTESNNANVFFGTKDTLSSEGYLSEDNTFTDGVLLKLTGTQDGELSFTYEAEVWQGEEAVSTTSGSATCEIETGLFTIS